MYNISCVALDHSDSLEIFRVTPVSLAVTRLRLLNFIGMSVFSQISTWYFLRKVITPTFVCNSANLMPEKCQRKHYNKIDSYIVKRKKKEKKIVYRCSFVVLRQTARKCRDACASSPRRWISRAWSYPVRDSASDRDVSRKSVWPLAYPWTARRHCPAVCTDTRIDGRAEAPVDTSLAFLYISRRIKEMFVVIVLQRSAIYRVGLSERYVARFKIDALDRLVFQTFPCIYRSCAYRHVIASGIFRLILHVIHSRDATQREFFFFSSNLSLISCDCEKVTFFCEKIT